MAQLNVTATFGYKGVNSKASSLRGMSRCVATDTYVLRSSHDASETTVATFEPTYNDTPLMIECGNSLAYIAS